MTRIPLPETTEFIRVTVATRALRCAEWPVAELVAYKADLVFLRAVILDCRDVIRMEADGLTAIRELQRALLHVGVNLLVHPPTRAEFREIWRRSGMALRLSEPTAAQDARAVPFPPPGDTTTLTASVA
jgi:hypothetical protein